MTVNTQYIISIYLIQNSEYDRIRLDTGNYYLKTVGNLVGGTMRVNLYDALILGSITTTEGQLNFTAHVNSMNYIIVFDINTNGNENNSQFKYVPRKTKLPRGEKSGYQYNPEAVCGNKGEIQHCQYSMLAGGDFAVAHQVIKRTGGYKIYMTIDNSVTFNITRKTSALDGAIALIEKYVPYDYNKLINEHLSFWHSYYPKSFLTIPHKKSESFYWIQVLYCISLVI